MWCSSNGTDKVNAMWRIKIEDTVTTDKLSPNSLSVFFKTETPTPDLAVPLKAYVSIIVFSLLQNVT